MTSARRWWLATIVVAVVVLLGVAWWFLCGRERAAVVPHDAGRTAAELPERSRGLDVAAFRAQLARRRATARELAQRHPRATPPADAKPRSHLGSMMLEPACILGPIDLCDSIAESVAACDDGDGQACFAVGQYLEDNPPRPMITISFYLYACKSGEQAGCDRMTAIKTVPAGPPPPCEDDPMACVWQATKAEDQARLDDACAAGVADACAAMLVHTEHDPPRARAYLATSCQLGNPMACEELGRRLSPGCAESCYSPDAAAAAEASTIACDVGFADACKRLGETP